ncbi:pentatricopeptide repeat-containing protein At2g06000 [Magnolia sinica]|uniref:pentatricopeptide repeat-containing protein At2g06000 n=1 Tax=Magnolia sinica TaxID=86752 RepID=UPI00265895DE|nr:pentatricopeptide repeat-containing protein At2g06000 [Magnolia sinica]
MLLHRLQHSNSRRRLIARFHRACSNPTVDRDPIPNPSNPTSSNRWIIKVISTLFIHSPSLGALSSFFIEALTPSVAYAVIRRLGNRNPKLALDFFEFTKSTLGFSHSVGTYSCLIRVLCETGLHKAAKSVLDCMMIDGHSADKSLLGDLVSAHALAGNYDSAMDLLVKAEEYKCRPNSVMYNNLLNLMVKKNRVEDAVRFFTEGHFHPDTCTFNIVIKGLCKLGDVDRAFKVFSEMGSFDCRPDIVTYNTLVNGLCRSEKVDRARELLDEVRSNGVCSPDVVTYTSIIRGYCEVGRMDEASLVFKEMVVRFGIRPSLVTYNVMINGYGKAGDTVSAVSLFEKMAVDGCLPDVVTLTSLIDGYCRNGQLDDAMRLWDEMEGRKLFPNVYTYGAVINGLCKENRLNKARELLMQLKGRRDIVPRLFMYNPVIDGFCKAGNVDEANIIVKEMEEKGCVPDKITFTILIIGHCMKGRMREAIGLFDRMLAIGCAPDTIMISCLVSILLKAGMPNEATQIVQTVSAKDFNLNLASLSQVCSLKKNMDIPVAV